jgi:putative ABC transport system ATP-binding protein
VTHPLIDLKQVRLTLTSRAGPVQILRGVDLQIAAGEAVAIAGPSGSGKSTLLMIMTGLEKASAGQVHIAGHDFMALDEDGLARVRATTIGIVFQSFHLIPTMTALENVALPLEFAHVPDAFDRAGEALGMVGLGHRLRHFPGELSGGEQQRTALARALAPEPQILFADEPTGNLDLHNGEQVMDLMFDLRKQKRTTLVLITHDHALARRCGRTVEMRDGLAAPADTAEAALA